MRNEEIRTAGPCIGRHRCPAGDRGGASILLLAVGLVLLLVGLFGAAVGAARTARQQARVAADFAALAGAGISFRGAETACRRAAELAAANGARLAKCHLDGLDVQVTAEVTVAPLPGLHRKATVTSRAGPVRG
ncbi:Rv3654c family TadE-like protein [Micromonospora sp. NPDC050187]|uniref:Rv3654c family TadE-like protein n=1 Tax=Micromonospora sp. NPDC050187 TaxID=3364277 RepID=UPI0037B17F82